MRREHIHLIGIGGTGMTALAGLLHESGARVTGSDRRLYPPTSQILEELGLDVREGFDPANLEPAPDLVVVGNAVSRGNPEVEQALDLDLPFTSMARLLSERFLARRHAIVVAGTHGKTTTSSMLAWVLSHAGRAPGFLIGGLPRNFERPFRLGTGEAFVIEGDEYDTAFFDKGPKFMHYRPDTVLLGTIEYDHADIYPDLDAVRLAFRRLVNIVPRRGLLIRHEDCEAARDVSRGAFCRVEGFGFGEATWRASDYAETSEGSRFRVWREGRPWLNVVLPMHGEHNARNALSVVAAAAEQGLDPREIARGLAEFAGVARRLDVRGQAAGVVVLDDFAHHPTAIEATLGAVRRAHPDRRIWAVLEPRSGTLRRNVFQERLPAALAVADEVLLAPVWRADGIVEGERLDPERVASELRDRGVSAARVADTDAIVERIRDDARSGDVVVIMSNGAFDDLHERVLSALRARAVVAEPGPPPAG